LSFFGGVLSVPVEELDRLRGTELWPPIIADAKASLVDLRALSRFEFRPERFRGLLMPVLLQIGTGQFRAARSSTPIVVRSGSTDAGLLFAAASAGANVVKRSASGCVQGYAASDTAIEQVSVDPEPAGRH